MKKKFVIGAALLALVLGALLLPGYMKKTSTPAYCASCHVMEDQYEHWFYSGSHRSIACVDCHLPHDNFVKYYFWKGYDGMKDVFFFYSGLVPDMIHSSSHAKKTIQANCVRCHEGMVMRISTENRQCWDCHRTGYHNTFAY